MPGSDNPYTYEIIRLVRLYEDHGTPRYLASARALMLAMAIEQGLTAVDVGTMAAAIDQATPP